MSVPDAISTYLYQLVHLLPPTVVVMRLASLSCFEDALTTAWALKVDMTEIFALMTVQCLRLISKADDTA